MEANLFKLACCCLIWTIQYYCKDCWKTYEARICYFQYYSLSHLIRYDRSCFSMDFYFNMHVIWYKHLLQLSYDNEWMQSTRYKLKRSPWKMYLFLNTLEIYVRGLSSLESRLICNFTYCVLFPIESFRLTLDMDMYDE